MPRETLLRLYQAVLAAVEGRQCVASHLSARPLAGRVWAIAIGKAASAMLAGAFEHLGERLERALLITKHGHLQGRAFPRCESLEAAHPVPDASSLAAGQHLLALMAMAPADIHWLFLISGGASSLVEVLPEGVSLVDMQRVNRWLLASGLPIDRMNAWRRRLSCIKGGCLGEYLKGRPARVLLISDVPSDDPATIGSGLLHPPPAADAVCSDEGPAWLQTLLSAAPPASPPRVAAGIETEIVASLDQALAAAAHTANALGYPVFRADDRLCGDAVKAGEQIAATLIDGRPGVYLWGGETTVQLPEQPGQGGRCQQLALAAARVLAGRDNIVLLAAGTDGNDGPGEVAGACVDGQTVARGRLDGFEAERALRHADAGSFLAAAGDLLETGATGTNVADVVIGLKMAGNGGVNS